MPAVAHATAYTPVRLSTIEAAAIAKRGRRCLRRGELTHRELCLLDCLLWSCRAPGGAIVASYTALQRLAHMARETIARGLRSLERVGLLSRVKRRLRLAWHQGGVRVRQLANAYRLHPPAAGHCEFGSATVIQESMKFVHCEPDFATMNMARAALAAVRARRSQAVGKLLRGGRGGV